MKMHSAVRAFDIFVLSDKSKVIVYIKPQKWRSQSKKGRQQGRQATIEMINLLQPLLLLLGKGGNTEERKKRELDVKKNELNSVRELLLNNAPKG